MNPGKDNHAEIEKRIDIIENQAHQYPCKADGYGGGGGDMSSYQPPYHLSETILSLSVEIGSALGAISLQDHMSRKTQLHRAN